MSALKHNHRFSVNILVILGFAALWECAQRPPERGHAVREVAGLILRHGELDVAEDELIVQSSRLGIIFCCIVELVHDE